MSSNEKNAKITERLLGNAGISPCECRSLRLISKALSRWHAMECGINGGCIERDEGTGTPFWKREGSQARIKIQDREKMALGKLEKIMSLHNELIAYVQGDPRGCALYIIRPGDIREGRKVDEMYTNGIAVM